MRKCLWLFDAVCFFFFLALKTGSCKTTYGQRISSSSFSLANGIPLWYAFSDWVVGVWVGGCEGVLVLLCLLVQGTVPRFVHFYGVP